jgi:hypothetical protein
MGSCTPIGRWAGSAFTLSWRVFAVSGRSRWCLLIVELLELSDAEISLRGSSRPGFGTGALNFGFVLTRLARNTHIGFRGKIETRLPDRIAQLGNAERLDILVQEVDADRGIEPSESRIQMSKNGGVILQLLLKEQKTKPRSGKPHSSRAGVRSAIWRLRSLTW